MTRDDVIKTYLPNFYLYNHLLSIDQQIDDHKRFNAYMRKEYSIDILYLILLLNHYLDMVTWGS